MTKRGTWCDGEEGYLYGDVEWPRYLEFGAEHFSAALSLTTDTPHGPPTKKDRIYFMADEVPEEPDQPGVSASRVLEKIMEALSEGRRVFVHAPTQEDWHGLYVHIASPDLVAEMFRERPQRPN